MNERERRGDGRGGRNKRKMTKRVIYRQRMKHTDFKENFFQKIDTRAVTNTSSLCYETVRDTSAKDDLIKTFSAMEHHVSLHSQTVGLLCKTKGNICKRQKIHDMLCKHLLRRDRKERWNA